MLKYFVFRDYLKKPFFHLIIIAAVGLIVYSNTFDVPFQWDEEFYIEKNPIVKDLSYFLHPSKAKGLEQYGALKSRYIGYLTFALNYKLHGLDVTGYHIFNIAIHLLNAKGMIDASIEHYLTAIRLRPNLVEAYFNLANAYGAKGAIDEAITYYRRVIDLKPDHIQARQILQKLNTTSVERHRQ